MLKLSLRLEFETTGAILEEEGDGAEVGVRRCGETGGAVGEYILFPGFF